MNIIDYNLKNYYPNKTWCELDVECLEMSVGVISALKRNGVTTLGHLAVCDLSQCEHIGPKRLSEILETARAVDLALRGDRSNRTVLGLWRVVRGLDEAERRIKREKHQAERCLYDLIRARRSVFLNYTGKIRAKTDEEMAAWDEVHEQT